MIRRLNAAGAVLTWRMKHARAHESKVIFVTTYSELLNAWDAGREQRSQHFVLTSHIDIAPEVQEARPNTWFGTHDATSESQRLLSVQVCCFFTCATWIFVLQQQGTCTSQNPALVSSRFLTVVSWSNIFAGKLFRASPS